MFRTQHESKCFGATLATWSVMVGILFGGAVAQGATVEGACIT